jgi:hypothetical protein
MNKMIRSFLMWMLGIIYLTVISFSCKKDNNDTGNEEELITTFRLTLKETGSAATKIFEFRDIDGTGGNPPSKFDPIVLNSGKNYACTIDVFNESVSPAVDITPEILAEGEDHQFYFEPAGVNINVLNLDKDSNGLPIGVTSNWNTGSAGSGTLKITLKHKPGAKALGDPVTKGETDIELNFTAQVQ